MQQDESGLAQHLASLADQYMLLAKRLIEAAKALEISGVLPSEELIQELTATRQEFQTLCGSVVALAHSLAIPSVPSADMLNSITDLQVVLQTIAAAEYQKREVERTRQAALYVVSRVLAITHRDNDDFAPLLDYQAEVRELGRKILDSQGSDLPPETQLLIDGKHPYCDLLGLVTNVDALDDEQWALLLKTVAQSCGRELSLAGARGRLIIVTEPEAESSIVNYAPLTAEAQSPKQKTAAAEQKGKKGSFRFETISLP